MFVAAIDEMPTNDPPPARTISRAACLSTYMEPLTFRSTVLRHACESVWVSGPRVSEPPAQCTTPSSRPVQSVTADIAASVLEISKIPAPFDSNLTADAPDGTALLT